MIEQLKTIRHVLELNGSATLAEALTALTQLEAMVGEPVARLHITETDTYPDIEVEVLNGTHLQPGMSPIPVYVAAPAAQQPQAKPHKPLFADLIAKHPGLREELLKIDKQPQAEKRCQYCDGTGDVHSIDGQWRGECHCQKQPQAEAVPADQSKWCAYIAGVIGCYLGEADDSAKVKAIAGIIERRLWALAPQQAEAAPSDVDWPDVEDMAHSALQEALSFGLNHDVFHRFGKSVMQKTRAAIAQQKGASHE